MDIYSWILLFVALALISYGLTLRFFGVKINNTTSVENPVVVKNVTTPFYQHDEVKNYVFSKLSTDKMKDITLPGKYDFSELSQTLSKKYDTGVEHQTDIISDDNKSISTRIWKIVVNKEQKHNIFISFEMKDDSVYNVTIYTDPSQDVKLQQLVAELALLRKLNDDFFKYNAYGDVISMNKKYIDLSFPNIYRIVAGKFVNIDINRASKEFNSYRDLGGVGTLITGETRTGKSVLNEALLVRAFTDDTMIHEMPNYNVLDMLPHIRNRIKESTQSIHILDFGQLSEQYLTSNQQTATVATLLEFVSEWAFSDKKVSWIAVSNTSHVNLPEVWKGRFNNILEMKRLTEMQLESVLKDNLNPAYKMLSIPMGTYSYADKYKFIQLRENA